MSMVGEWLLNILLWGMRSNDFYEFGLIRRSK